MMAVRFLDYDVDHSSLNADGSINWSLTGNGERILVRDRKGNKLLLKRLVDIRRPDPALASFSPKSFETMRKRYLTLLSRRRKVAAALGPLSLEKDRIAKELEIFSDGDNFVYVVTPYLEKAVDPSAFDFSKKDQASFLPLCAEMAEEVGKLHEAGIVHSDIKVENFVYQRLSSGIAAYLIDFDASFPVGDPPLAPDVQGSHGYFPPENLVEEGEVDHPEKRGTAIDVFALGIAYHVLYAKAFPEVEGKLSVGEALKGGRPFKIDPSLDKLSLGSGTFGALLRAMLQPDPEQRPSLQEVRLALFGKSADFLERKSGAPKKKKREPAPAKKAEPPAELLVPWEGDGILFVSDLKAKGVRHIARNLGVMGSYIVTYEDGLSIAMKSDRLVVEGLARKKEKAVPSGTVATDGAPFPEDGIAYSLPALVQDGITSIAKKKVNGQRFYEAKRNGKSILLSPSSCLFHHYISRK